MAIQSPEQIRRNFANDKFNGIFLIQTLFRTEMSPNIRIWLSLSHWQYRQTSNIGRALVRNKIFDHSDVVEASPVGVAPTTSSSST